MHYQGHIIEPQTVIVYAGRIALTGDLMVPANPRGIIAFAHGSGSGRLSPRNRAVAESLVTCGFATLLFDLLSREEEIAERDTRHHRFNIPLLAERLVGTVAWMARQEALANLPIGLFGASTGAAAALIASTRSAGIGAVVSRGGRPDLAADALPLVRCPTLLIVGGADTQVIELNHQAMRRMRSPTRIHIVPGAGHLFEEPGAMQEVTIAAADWFQRHLAPQHRHREHAPL